MSGNNALSCLLVAWSFLVAVAPARAAQLPEVRERFLGLELEPLTLMPREFHAFIAADLKKWAAVVKAANIKAE